MATSELPKVSPFVEEAKKTTSIRKLSPKVEIPDYLREEMEFPALNVNNTEVEKKPSKEATKPKEVRKRYPQTPLMANGLSLISTKSIEISDDGAEKEISTTVSLPFGEGFNWENRKIIYQTLGGVVGIAEIRRYVNHKDGPYFECGVRILPDRYSDYYADKKGSTRKMPPHGVFLEDIIREFLPKK